MTTNAIQIVHGFAPADRDRVAELYWQAFRDKLGKIMGPERKALAFLTRVLDPSHAICAYDGDRLWGVAGFKTAQGALAGGGWDDMCAVYGPIGAAWRAGLVSLLERDVDNDRFLMDGIFVAAEARGRGVGTILLREICAEAARRGYAQVRLDVIDSNPRARALYEREGFRPGRVDHTGPFRFLFGFRHSTLMVKDVTPAL